MKSRTVILTELIAAAKAIDDMQEALTRAFVALQSRSGDEAGEALGAVVLARDLAYEPAMADLIERAITTAGKMP